MRERIVDILGRFRRQVVAVRSAEAAAVAGAAGALAAAFLMVARILTARHPAIAAGLCAAPLAGGMALAAWGRARRRLNAQPMIQWCLPALLMVCGAAALAAQVAGLMQAVPKNLLILIAPAAAAVAAGLVLARPAPVGSVAALLDRRARLAERLSTAWELHQRRDGSAFARAVQHQAALAAKTPALSRVRFWDRTRATAGALGLALAVAALMLPWEPLESPHARQARLWRQAGPQAAELLEMNLPILDAETIASAKDLPGHLRRLEALTASLRSARPEEAAEWQGRVIELDRIAQALREVIRSGRADPTATRRIRRLLEAIERASTELAEAMAAGGAELARAGAEGVEPDQVTPARPAQTQPSGWTTVFNPQYVELLGPTTASAPGDGGPAVEPPPQVPYDRQWAAARARAADALGKAPLPGPYRQLIRDFYSPTE